MSFNNLCKNIRLGNFKNVKLLVEKMGSNIFQNNNLCAQIASGNGRLDILKYLVSKGLDIRSRDDWAIRWASTNGHLHIVRYLVTLNADVTIKNNWCIRLASMNGYYDLVVYLVECGADVQTRNNYPIRIACAHGYMSIVIYLKEHGADINDGALCWASKYGFLDIVKYLIEQGADIHTNNDESIWNASVKYNFEIVKYLTEQGANKNNISKKCKSYFAFCKKMKVKNQIQSVKKIYFWWICIYYNLNKLIGHRTMYTNYLEYKKIIGSEKYINII